MKYRLRSDRSVTVDAMPKGNVVLVTRLARTFMDKHEFEEMYEQERQWTVTRDDGGGYLVSWQSDNFTGSGFFLEEDAAVALFKFMEAELPTIDEFVGSDPDFNGEEIRE
jgi:hypothetical protein